MTRLRWKIVSSFVMCLLSLLAAVGLTFSWFAYNRRATGGGIAVEGRYENDVIGVAYYRVTPNEASGSYGLTPIESQVGLSLGTYDALRNNYSLVMKIYLKHQSVGDTVTLSAETAATYFLGDYVEQADGTIVHYPLLPPDEANIALPDDEGAGYTNSLSSVVAFAALTEDEVSALGAGTLENLPSGERLATFVDAEQVNEDGTHTPIGSITIAESGETSDVGIHREETLYLGTVCDAVYILITYDPLLVNTVFSANIGNTDMYRYDDGGIPYPIPFVCDFSVKVGT